MEMTPATTKMIRGSLRIMMTTRAPTLRPTTTTKMTMMKIKIRLLGITLLMWLVQAHTNSLQATLAMGMIVLMQLEDTLLLVDRLRGTLPVEHLWVTLLAEQIWAIPLV
jgi:hypothetical protein